jgi:hypothetical protein
LTGENFFIWLVVIAGIIYLVSAHRKRKAFYAEAICTECGSVGTPRRGVRGSFLIELVLWLCFIVPGLIYSAWRLSNVVRECPECGARSMVALSTPRGEALLRQYRR